MKTAKAIERLSWRLTPDSKGNYKIFNPNFTDRDALNQIIKDLNKQAEENVKEHYLFAKLYAVMLRVNTEFHGDIIRANLDLNKILSEPLEHHLQKLLIILKLQNVQNFFEHKNIYDPLLNMDSYERYSNLFPDITPENMFIAFDAWDMEKLEEHFKFTVNQSIINFKTNV